MDQGTTSRTRTVVAKGELAANVSSGAPLAVPASSSAPPWRQAAVSAAGPTSSSVLSSQHFPSLDDNTLTQPATTEQKEPLFKERDRFEAKLKEKQEPTAYSKTRKPARQRRRSDRPLTASKSVEQSSSSDKVASQQKLTPLKGVEATARPAMAGTPTNPRQKPSVSPADPPAEDADADAAGGATTTSSEVQSSSTKSSVVNSETLSTDSAPAPAHAHANETSDAVAESTQPRSSYGGGGGFHGGREGRFSRYNNRGYPPHRRNRGRGRSGYDRFQKRGGGFASNGRDRSGPPHRGRRWSGNRYRGGRGRGRGGHRGGLGNHRGVGGHPGSFQSSTVGGGWNTTTYDARVNGGPVRQVGHAAMGLAASGQGQVVGGFPQQVYHQQVVVPPSLVPVYYHQQPRVIQMPQMQGAPHPIVQQYILPANAPMASPSQQQVTTTADGQAAVTNGTAAIAGGMPLQTAGLAQKSPPVSYPMPPSDPNSAPRDHRAQGNHGDVGQTVPIPSPPVAGQHVGPGPAAVQNGIATTQPSAMNGVHAIQSPTGSYQGPPYTPVGVIVQQTEDNVEIPEGTVLVLDVQYVATGPYHDDRAVAHIALVNDDCKVVLNVYVKPDKPVRSFLYQLTSLREEELSKYGLAFDKALDLLRSTLRSHSGGVVLVGQKIKKDIAQLGLVEGDDYKAAVDIADVWRVYNPRFKAYTKFSLDHLAMCLLNRQPTGRHNAALDAILAMRVFNTFLHFRRSVADLETQRQHLLAVPTTKSFNKRFPFVDEVCMGNVYHCRCPAKPPPPVVEVPTHPIGQPVGIGQPQ